MDFDVFVVIGFGAGRLAANVARVRPDPRVHFQMLREVVTSVKGLSAIGHLARVHLLVLVLFHVPQAVVLSDELASAVVARVRSDGLVRVHVRGVIRLPDESALTELAFERLAGAVGVRPLVQLQIPLGGEVFVTDDARVRFVPRVSLHVRFDGRLEVHLVAHRTRDVLVDSLLVGHEVVIVSPPHVPSERSDVDKLLVAVKTRFGLVVVNLLMPGELLLRMEHLPACAYVISQLFFHFKVVPVSMLSHIGITTEGEVAQIALDGSFSGVHVPVLQHFLSRYERFSASVASETIAKSYLR